MVFVHTGSNGLGVSSSGTLSAARGVLGKESRYGVSESSWAAECGRETAVDCVIAEAEAAAAVVASATVVSCTVCALNDCNVPDAVATIGVPDADGCKGER
jgi:hypothetical protein